MYEAIIVCLRFSHTLSYIFTYISIISLSKIIINECVHTCIELFKKRTLLYQVQDDEEYVYKKCHKCFINFYFLS